MARRRRYPIEVDILAHYFSRDANISEVLRLIRQGLLDNECRNIDKGLIERAKGEFLIKRRALDDCTYPFAQDLSRYMIPKGENARVIMLVDGYFGGNGTLDSIIPIDLGINPYQLFRSGIFRGTTIDEYVTREKTAEFIDENLEEMFDSEFQYFQVDMSRFFHFQESDLERFRDDDGELDLVELTRHIVPTKGYVVFEEVEAPSVSDYTRLVPLFTSYRLKQSLLTKCLYKLRLKPTKKESLTEIKDWVAHRIITEYLQDARDLEEFLKESPKIRNSEFEYLDTDDYYLNRRESGFKAIRVVGRVTPRGRGPGIREIQLIPRRDYYTNEHTPGRVNHDEYKKHQLHVPKNQRKAYDFYEKILKKIFGTEEMVISFA